MTARLAAVAAAHAHILARRRTAVALLALLPLAIYGALYRHSPHAVTVGGVASAFSAGGAAIFSMLPARAADQRLALAGYRPAVLLTGIAAVPLGLALGALLPRELEAVLVLIGIVGIQITADPDTVISAVLP